jgi:hypothetical protein
MPASGLRTFPPDSGSIQFKSACYPHCHSRFASLPIQCSRVMVVLVRFLALILIALLLPLGLSVESAMACSRTACCANCSKNAPVNQLNCCKAPAVPDKATNQARDAQHFGSIGSLPATGVKAAISPVRSLAVSQGYSPPNRLLSLALLCSRQI